MRKPKKMPFAFSYLRFSDPRQSAGDSVRRQTADRDEWLADHPDVILDQTLEMSDRGRSAFRRKNWDTYALAQFVKLIGGRVEPGSYLLVENLDRLSREEEGVATELFLSIINRGVIIVQLSPHVKEFRRPVGVADLFSAILDLSRGHGESKIKSTRVGEAWAEKRRNAGQELVTHRVPGWIRVQPDGRRVADPAATATVKRIFALAADGHGLGSIAQQLHDDRVPLIGKLTFKGKPVTWSGSLVRYIILNRAVLGEFQPHIGSPGDRQPAGDVLPHYYPRIIDERAFHAAHGGLATRRKCGRGRPAAGVNLFAGLLKNARDGGTLTHWKRRREGLSVIIPTRARLHANTGWTSFPTRDFEKAIVSKLEEVTVADVEGPSADRATARVEDLTALATKNEANQKYWTAQMDDEDLRDVVAEHLRKLKREEKRLEAQIADAQREAASPIAECWGRARSLAKLLTDDASDEFRARVKAAFHRSIESVYCLFHGTQYFRIAAVQVHFRGSAHTRKYVIRVIHGGRNARIRKRAKCDVEAAAWRDQRGELDLRNPKHAARVLRELEHDDYATRT
jgi:DNA invertase Pin-like site-specific DNA recombinase